MNDFDLQRLLRRWRDIEPAGSFEANVRRRIRLATPEPKRIWLWRPAFAAVALSIVIGALAGVFSFRQQPAEMKFMSAGTLAGNYPGGWQ
jgi:hypothetical protein